MARQIFILLFTAILLLFSQSSIAANDAIWDKILAKQTIRCGYITYEPGFSKNLKTGEFSGYDKDIMEAVAKRLELKIDWVPASSWGTFVEDMKTGKFDMLCNLTWLNSKNAKYVLYSRTVMYQPAFFVARKDDTRFDKDISIINDPKYSIAVLEEDIPSYFAKEEYPKAKLNNLPANFDFSLVVNEVSTKKSDLAIADAVTVGQYQAANPGKVKLVKPDSPIHVFSGAFVYPSGEAQMKHAIDYTLDEMIMSGDLKAIFAKYNKFPHSYYFPEIDYQKN